IFRQLLYKNIGCNTLVFYDVLSIQVKNAEVRRCNASTVKQRRVAGNTYQYTHGRSTYQLAESFKAEHIWHHVASRSGIFIDNHGLWSVYPISRCGKASSIPYFPTGYQLARQQIDNIVRYRSSSVIPLVEQERVPIQLRELITIEVGISVLPRIRHIDIRYFSVAYAVNLFSLAFYPI